MGSTLELFALSVLAWWVVVLAHELGHGVVGLAGSEGLVVVRTGGRSPRWRRRFGRLELDLGLLPSLFRSKNEAQVYARFSKRTAAALLLAGPAAGCLAAAAIALLGVYFQVYPLEVVGLVVLALELGNLVPFRARGSWSDGLYLVKALRGRAAIVDKSQFETIVSRWFVLATDFRAAFGAEDQDIRTRFNSKMRDAKADGNERAIAIHRLTFAGWCWRKAEQGDTTVIRETVLDARHNATRVGLSRANIVAAAAGQLVRERIDFEAGSPIPGSLEMGFLRVRENPRYGELSDDTARTAFCFGVAMHDVAAIAG